MFIIGLGNPGKKYENTRHNVGHMFIDEIEKALRQAQGKQNLDDFILAKTDAFMNESGKSVKQLTKNYKSRFHRGSSAKPGLKTNNLIIVHDDIDIPLGQFKVQKGRGSAGHKGVQSIIDELKTNDFWRIRIGICPKEGKPENVERFVLQKFSKEEQKILENVTRSVLVTVKESEL